MGRGAGLYDAFRQRGTCRGSLSRIHCPPRPAAELTGADRARADFDALVIGAGQAGPSLALRLAGAGMKIAVVERKAVGGTCVNTGCTPTKTLVASAYAAHLARRASEYGV